MRRDLRIALLAAGVVLGFGWGLHHLRTRSWERRLAWERHVAGLCVDAARGAPARHSPSLSPGDEPVR
ncbi:MAG TPA: hypothetical protein VLT82_13735 [Myxococcaceae bacterium]|nr:hypothetical protein [Myxococcaceae bacterium]